MSFELSNGGQLKKRLFPPHPELVAPFKRFEMFGDDLQAQCCLRSMPP